MAHLSLSNAELEALWKIACLACGTEFVLILATQDQRLLYQPSCEWCPFCGEDLIERDDSPGGNQ